MEVIITDIVKYLIAVAFIFLVVSLGYTIWSKTIDRAFGYISDTFGENVAEKLSIFIFLILFIAIIISLIF